MDVGVKKIQIKCPSCDGEHTVRHGYNVTKTGKFARRKCQQCGTTFYENHSKTQKGGIK